MTQTGRAAADFGGWTSRKAIVFGMALGAAAALGQSPVSWPLVSMAAFVATFVIFSRIDRPRRAALFGWAFGAGYFAVSLFWIVDPFLVDPEIHGWMAPFALVGMAGGLALFWLLAFALAFRIGARPRLRVAALVMALALGELARAYLLTGFPWAHPAYIWVETPIRQVASLVGPHGLGLLTLAAAALSVMTPRIWQGGVASVMLGLAALAYGTWRQDAPLPIRPEATNLRLVQPNAPQSEKWQADKAAEFYARMLAFTAAPAETPPDLVIWPEASVTFWLEDWTPEQADIAAAAGPDAEVIIGARRFHDGLYYNALAALDRDGRAAQVYNKTRLVPFGEYIPFGRLLATIGLHGLAAEDGGGFSAGSGERLIDLGTAGRALPLICYEVIFPHYLFVQDRPDWLLQITNDAWFGEAAGPQQHFAQARFRAVEQGLPLVRVANTGISGVIDAHGAVVGRLELGTAGYLDLRLPGALPPTLYSRTGDLPILVLLLAGLATLAVAARRN